MSRPMHNTPPLVAVVDDSPDVRLALERLLCAAGFATASFPSGNEFLSSIAEREPDCVVLDLHMPGLSGFDVQSRLAPAHSDIPVVLITACHTAESRLRASRNGAKAYLCKPVDEQALLDAIEAAIVH